MSTNALLDGALGDGVIDNDAFDVLSGVDLGDDSDTGVSIDDIQASEVILVNLLVDDSSSINWGAEDPATGQRTSNVPFVIDGHNLIPNSLEGAKAAQAENIIVMTTTLNSGLLSNYKMVSSATRLDTSNYTASGGTPLYERMLEVLRRCVEKTHELEDTGVSVRTITVVITDGDNNGGGYPSDVKKVVESLLMQEIHIVAAVGIDDGSTDFRGVFRDCGVPDQWILTPANNETEIRKAFAMVSQSAVTASQSADSFSQMAGGGFTN